MSKWLWAPFSEGERFNRLVAYNGAKYKFSQPEVIKKHPILKKLTGKDLDDAIAHEAARVVIETQFVPGPGTTSYVLGKFPPFARQFTTFPTRFLSWMVDSTFKGALESGELAKAGVLEKMTGGRNLGQVGRFLAGTGILMAFARDVLGVDIGTGLGGGIIPMAPAGQPFAPLSLPPILSTPFDVVYAAASGDASKLRRVAQVWTPAGVQLNRIVRWALQFQDGAWVDENGRVIRRQPPWEAVEEMLGFPTIASRRESLLGKQLYNARGRIRQYRRAYAYAKLTSDLKRMLELKAQWKREFPNAPPLEITQKDLRQAWINAEKGYIQRLLNTGGRALADITGTVMLQEMSRELGQVPFEQLGVRPASLPYMGLNPPTPFGL